MAWKCLCPRSPGELAPGAAVPSVKRLRDEGLVETVMGWGSFVAKGG
jgi:DNA-binding transcriptional regulator YhcF (GntR family)